MAVSKAAPPQPAPGARKHQAGTGPGRRPDSSLVLTMALLVALLAQGPIRRALAAPVMQSWTTVFVAMVVQALPFGDRERRSRLRAGAQGSERLAPVPCSEALDGPGRPRDGGGGGGRRPGQKAEGTIAARVPSSARAASSSSRRTSLVSLPSSSATSVSTAIAER